MKRRKLIWGKIRSQDERTNGKCCVRKTIARDSWDLFALFLGSTSSGGIRHMDSGKQYSWGKLQENPHETYQEWKNSMFKNNRFHLTILTQDPWFFDCCLLYEIIVFQNWVLYPCSQLCSQIFNLSDCYRINVWKNTRNRYLNFYTK